MIDDDYDDYEGDAHGAPGWIAAVYRWLIGIGCAATLAFGGVYLHYNFSGGGTAGPQQGDVPLIRAAKGPIKVRPADPGGREVPNRNLDVYKEFDTARLKRLPGSPSEDLLVPGKPRAPAKQDSVPKGPVCHRVPSLLADTDRYRLAALKLATAGPAVSRQANIRKTAERRPNRIVPKAAKTAGSGEPVGKPRKAAKPGSFRIQLGAFRTRAKAANLGRGLQRRHRNLLGGLNMVVERVDLGTKGIFYRLRAGPIANRKTARRLCQSLGKQRVNCFLVSG